MKTLFANTCNLLKNNNYSFARKVRTAIQLQKEEEKELEEEFEVFPEAISMVQDQVRKEILQKLSYQGEDPSPNKLVNRPGKGAVWGLGGQLVLATRKMELEGIKQDPEQIIKFLQLHQVKNIYIHDWLAEEDKEINRRRYSIIGSCFSSRHCWRTGLELKNAFNKNILSRKRNSLNGRWKSERITALFNGRKDDEWTMVEYKDFEISLMTEEQREAVDLQWKWNNPVSDEVIDRHVKNDNNKKKRKGQFEQFD